MITGVQVRDKARSFDGKYRYDQGPQRTTGELGYIDCSGTVVLDLNDLGVRGVPTVSSTQATWCRDNHCDRCPLDIALKIPGMLLFEGPDFGYEGYGNDGHVAITVGDAVNVIESRGHAYPATWEYSALGRPWTNAAFIPGVDYATHPSKPVVVPKLARVLHFVQPPGTIMRGDDILDVQTKLYGWAYIARNAAMNPGAHDGGYGRSTAAAVVAFQKAAGITADAIVGPQTWASLYRI